MILDEIIEADGYKCTAKGLTLVITKGEEKWTKEYASQHAIGCAMGRMKHDKSMIETIVTSVKIRDMRKKSKEPKYYSPLRSNRIAALLIDDLSFCLGKKPEEVIRNAIDMALEDVEDETNRAKETARLLKDMLTAANRKLKDPQK